MMHRFLYNSLILKLLLLTILFASSGLTAGLSKSRGKKKLTKENVCDIKNQRSPIFCYCNNSGLRNASDVDCWVLDKFDQNDPMWSYFTSQIQVEKLSFTVRQGSFDYVPSQLLQQLKNLREFKIQYGTLYEIAEHTFNNLGVAKINLSRNTIIVLRKYAFENMRNLTVINLDYNRISEINRDTFLNLANLNKLYLNHNNISTVHDKAFKSLPSLQELDLGSNQITVITRDSFHGLRKLQRLDLRNNKIAMLGDRLFAEMQELTELELDQNQIKYISNRAFDNMYNLRKLHLSENHLEMLEPDFLAGAPGVHFLDLRDNLLKLMTFDNIKPIVTNLYDLNSYFYLDGNNLTCDCKLAWIWGLRNETKNTKLRDALEELTCFLESNNATQKINSEDLGRNQPRYIPNKYVNNNSRADNNEDDDEAENDDYTEYDEDDEKEKENENSHFRSKSTDSTDSNKCCKKHLFELKPEELPCPQLSREDLMASEQPSSRHENARASGSSWFSSGSISVQAGQSVLVASLLLLSILFFT